MIDLGVGYAKLLYGKLKMTTSSMKIVMIGPLPPYRGGITHFTQALTKQLINAGHIVLSISYRKQYPKLDE